MERFKPNQHVFAHLSVLISRYETIWKSVAPTQADHFLCLCSKRVLLTEWVVSDLSTTFNSLKSNYSLLRKQRMVSPVKGTVTIPVSVGGLAHLNRYLHHSSDNEGLTPWSRFASTDISPCCGIILQKFSENVAVCSLCLTWNALSLCIFFFLSTRFRIFFCSLFSSAFHCLFLLCVPHKWMSLKFQYRRNICSITISNQWQNLVSDNTCPCNHVIMK